MCIKQDDESSSYCVSQSVTPLHHNNNSTIRYNSGDSANEGWTRGRAESGDDEYQDQGIKIRAPSWMHNHQDQGAFREDSSVRASPAYEQRQQHHHHHQSISLKNRDYVSSSREYERYDGRDEGDTDNDVGRRISCLSS